MDLSVDERNALKAQYLSVLSSDASSDDKIIAIVSVLKMYGLI